MVNPKSYSHSPLIVPFQHSQGPLRGRNNLRTSYQYPILTEIKFQPYHRIEIHDCAHDIKDKCQRRSTAGMFVKGSAFRQCYWGSVLHRMSGAAPECLEAGETEGARMGNLG